MLPECDAYETDAVDPDADADDRLPAGLGGPKRKRKASGGMRRAKKAAKDAEKEEGGYTDKGRIAFRDKGGLLITGGKRTCLPDAVCMLDSTLDVDDIRSIMPDDPDEDTRFTAADEHLKHRCGLTLERVTARFMKAGGVAVHLLNTKGLFVVQLRIADGKDDPKPDKHCVAYDGVTVRDNYRHSKVKELDASDRVSPDAARTVFDSLFKPGLIVRIKNVYELRQII